MTSLLQDGFRLRIGDDSSSFWYDFWTQSGPLCHLVDYVHISDTQLRIKDCWLEGKWCFDSLFSIVNEPVKKLIEEIPAPLVSSHLDAFIWLFSPTGIYTASSGYRQLSRHRASAFSFSLCQVCWLPTPYKVSFLIWLALHNSLPMNHIVVGMGLQTLTCVLDALMLQRHLFIASVTIYRQGRFGNCFIWIMTVSSCWICRIGLSLSQLA